MTPIKDATDDMLKTVAELNEKRRMTLSLQMPLTAMKKKAAFLRTTFRTLDQD